MIARTRLTLGDWVYLTEQAEAAVDDKMLTEQKTTRQQSHAGTVRSEPAVATL